MLLVQSRSAKSMLLFKWIIMHIPIHVLTFITDGAFPYVFWQFCKTEVNLRGGIQMPTCVDQRNEAMVSL